MNIDPGLSAFAANALSKSGNKAKKRKKKEIKRRNSPQMAHPSTVQPKHGNPPNSLPSAVDETEAKKRKLDNERPQKNVAAADSSTKTKEGNQPQNEVSIVGGNVGPPQNAGTTSEQPNENRDVIQVKKEVRKWGKLKVTPPVKSNDSVKVGQELFSWMISPIGVSDFFDSTWEKKPLVITRSKSDFYKEVCTLNDVEEAFSSGEMYFTKNVDVTSYVNGVRTTENPEGKAKPSIVWDLYNKGKSIRLLNPQTFILKIRKVITVLQDFFRCFVGANIYLTPPNSQGFAPHYDDIEAFVLQLDGKKKWKLYNPKGQVEILPRESSANFSVNEIGEPVLEVTLQPGDLLYFPRGTIHQAECAEEHSLHITISCYQRNSWADLLEKAVPAALQLAIEEDVEYREGLPRDYLDHTGLIHSDSESPERSRFLKKIRSLMAKLIDYCPIDACVDQLGKEFMHASLPPIVTERDFHRFVDVKPHKGIYDVLQGYKNKRLGVKLIRAYACRLVSEDDSLKLYYTTHNSLEYHGEEPIYMVLPVEWAAMIDALMRRYPKFTDMGSLPIEGDRTDGWGQIVALMCELWKRELLLFDKPLKIGES